MNENILFLNMFSRYEPPEALKSVLSQAAITAADIDSAARKISAAVFIPQYINGEKLSHICEDISNLYGLSGLEIKAIYPADQLRQMPPEDWQELFVSHNSMALGVLAGANWHWEEETLVVELRANGKTILEESLPAVRQSIYDRFSCGFDLEIRPGQNLQGQDLFDAMAKMRKSLIADIPAAIPAERKEKPADSDGTIYGKPFKTKPVPMKELELDMGNVVVEGKVFNLAHKELAKRNAWVINLDITDNTSSIRVSRFLENTAAKPLLEGIKLGDVIKVQGKLMIDNFTNDMVLRPNGIMPGAMAVREDLSQVGKRVELHLHTAMSNMDALTDVQEAMKQAARWGHRAMAITDHGCVQSFTDALHLIEDKKKAPTVAGTNEKLKILYGCEGYYVNDVDDCLAVHGHRDMPIDGEYVAFDLETTGLRPRFDKIIEIGAVRMKNGVEIDRFQTFVDPGEPLRPEIVLLTGITDMMIKGAPGQKEALTDFMKFVGESVLVAHNAEFDGTFVRRSCKRLGIPCEITTVDTLTISQNLLTELPKYTLDTVAKFFELGDFDHHRAADDALICGKIMAKLAGKLREMGISRIQGINRAMLPLRPAHRKDNIHAQHIVLFAKNQQGLRNLYHLISDANIHYFKKKPRIFKSQLMKMREGLIVGSACENNEFFQGIVFGKDDEELKRIADFYDYLEIQPISNNRFMLTAKREKDQPLALSDEDLREFNRTVVRIGEETGKPVVATGDVHFLNPEDEIFRRILLATKSMNDERENPLYFRTTDEMLEEFSYLGEEKAREVVITNPNYIVDMCDQIRPVPHNLFAPTIENSAEDLKRLVYEKMHRLYGDPAPEIVKKRVEAELGGIIGSHYDVIYMSAQKLVQNSLDNGYLVGSRGSVGSSLVAFMSGITEVNSLPPHYRCPNPECKHSDFDVPAEFGCGADLPDAVCPVCGVSYEKDGFNIPFETFLGFGGGKMPDIDLNFSGEYQANAHAYCTELFGKSHVFRAGTVGTVAEKTAFGYVKKYLDEQGIEATNAEVSRLSAGCVGVRRTTGQHPGGLVVIPQENEIWDFCPVQRPADDPKSDQITTHFEYHSMEENLLKLDMLGHDDPTMIKKMEEVTGVDAKTIPLDDKKTMSIFTSSKVLGYENDELLGPTGAVAVPEFNTRFTRGVLLDTKPEKFDFLVRISGYTHGTDVWLGNAKDLIVSGTARVDQTIGCRDDIMIYLISCGIPEERAFKIMEAVRKGKGLPEGAPEEMRAAGIPEWYIGSCEKIQYLFPKAHAVAYVMMAFRIAWFKVYHPLAFYAAYFYRRSQKGGFDAVTMTRGIETVRANIAAIDANENATAKDEDMLTTLEVAYEFYLRGLEFLPIDIYKSDAKNFIIEDGKLRPPFVAIPGLGESAADDLVKGREGKQFISVEEVSAACPKVSKTHIQLLKEAGAFGSLPDTNQVSLF